MNRIKRARGTNSVMTGVFYLIAVFFFALLISFASYVIIKGFSGATPEMFRFLRKGSIGNQLFNTIYLVFISLVFSVPLGVTAGIYLSMYAKKGFIYIASKYGENGICGIYPKGVRFIKHIRNKVLKKMGFTTERRKYDHN